MNTAALLELCERCRGAHPRSLYPCRRDQPQRGRSCTSWSESPSQNSGIANWHPTRLRVRAVAGFEVIAVADADVIVQDLTTGLFGFRLEVGRDRNGSRMQA